MNTSLDILATAASRPPNPSSNRSPKPFTWWAFARFIKLFNPFQSLGRSTRVWKVELHQTASSGSPNFKLFIKPCIQAVHQTVYPSRSRSCSSNPSSSPNCPSKLCIQSRSPKSFTTVTTPFIKPFIQAIVVWWAFARFKQPVIKTFIQAVHQTVASGSSNCPTHSEEVFQSLEGCTSLHHNRSIGSSLLTARQDAKTDEALQPHARIDERQSPHPRRQGRTDGADG